MNKYVPWVIAALLTSYLLGSRDYVRRPFETVKNAYETLNRRESAEPEGAYDAQGQRLRASIERSRETMRRFREKADEKGSSPRPAGKPAGKRLLSCDKMTKMDFDSVFAPSYQERMRIRFERGLACDADGDGRDDFIAAYTIMADDRENDRGVLEVFSGNRAVYRQDGLWNLQSDSIYVKDMGNDGRPEFFLKSTDAYGNTSSDYLRVYAWDGVMKELNEISWDILMRFDDADNDGTDEIFTMERIYGGECTGCPHRKRLKVYRWNGKRFEMSYDMETAEALSWDDVKHLVQ